jgi:hypothetical protein
MEGVCRDHVAASVRHSDETATRARPQSRRSAVAPRGVREKTHREIPKVKTRTGICQTAAAEVGAMEVAGGGIRRAAHSI